MYVSRCVQIRRYVYKDVVRVQDIQAHMDTTGIQTYTSNSAKVVFLRARPHSNIDQVLIMQQLCCSLINYFVESLQ